MRKKDLIEVVSRKAHLTKKAAKESVETFLNEIQKALIKGEKVIISGFGTFRIVSVKDKKVIVPKTGEEKIVKPHRAARFSPGRTLRRIIRG
jgi:nucleoid DNA-binding protein